MWSCVGTQSVATRSSCPSTVSVSRRLLAAGRPWKLARRPWRGCEPRRSLRGAANICWVPAAMAAPTSRLIPWPSGTTRPAPKPSTSGRPTFKWGITLANVADFSRPADRISYPQQTAVTATGLIWSRFSTQITPCAACRLMIQRCSVERRISRTPLASLFAVRRAASPWTPLFVSFTRPLVSNKCLSNASLSICSLFVLKHCSEKLLYPCCCSVARSA